MHTFSFDVGGVLESNATMMFLSITKFLRQQGHRVIVVTAIGHGDPKRWGYSEQARYGTSFSRILNIGYKQGIHFDELFVTPDPSHTSKATGRYKDFVLRREHAFLHVDDNPHVLAQIKGCRPVTFGPSDGPLQMKAKFKLAVGPGCSGDGFLDIWKP